MSKTTDATAFSDGSWPHSNAPMPVPDTSMLPGAEKAPPAAVELMDRVTQGAHDTIDLLADRAAPTVRQLGESLSGAEEALHAKAEQLRDTGEAWFESLRRTVRSSPLAAVAAAVLLGACIARIRR